METPKNLQHLVSQLPDIIEAAFTARNRERFSELTDRISEIAGDTTMFLEDIANDVNACVQIVLAMLQEPLEKMGVDLPATRSFSKYEIEPYVTAEIERRLKIIPYTTPKE